MKINIFSVLLFLPLFILVFLMGCSEGHDMRFPDLDLPDSVTVMVEASTGASFDIFVSSDYREEGDDLGNRFIVHNSEHTDAFTGNFSQTFSLVDSEIFPLVDPDERRFSVQLKCNMFEPVSKEDNGSFRLIIRFNGEGNFDDGNYDETYFLESTNEPLHEPNVFQLNDLIGVRIIFSRYDGISQQGSISSDYR
jgi:hypothetical protein